MRTYRKFGLFVGDCVVLALSFLGMLFVESSGEITHLIFMQHLYPFFILFLLWLGTLYVFNLYDARSINPTIPHLQKISLAWLTSMMVGVIFFYIFPTEGITPKTNFIVFSVLSFTLFLIWRRTFSHLSPMFFKKNFVVIAEEKNKHIEEFLNYVHAYPQSGLQFVGMYSSLKNLLEGISGKHIDTVIISKDANINPEDLKALYGISSNILYFEYVYEDILGKIPVDLIDHAWFFHNVRDTKKKIYGGILRIIGILLALLFLIITSPFLIITALAVKLYDGGSVFYSQLRVGKNGKVFRLYKFRSMSENAKETQWTEQNDHRITAVGKVIRMLHIDEVPQLINVIKGELALVGPRPELPEFAATLEGKIPHYRLRHIITPGFTGWAQIKFRQARGIEDSRKKFEYDLYYIKNRNIFLDFGIILKTIQIIFTHAGK